MKIKIIGAGSIGNHYANAASSLGWEVIICDIDEKALKRTKEEIYPQRYGIWNDSIKLFQNEAAPRGGFDIVFVGTPPDTHIPIALEALKEAPRAILIEKPICTPEMKNVEDFLKIYKSNKTKVFVGYDHVLGDASQKVKELIDSKNFGEAKTLDVEFREFWGGIFDAHPWLSGPHDTYLGFWERGGGAAGEHSHGINLWQFFSNILGRGNITEVQANINYVKNDLINYDEICLMNFRTESDLLGRCVQDVVTSPSRKWARIQFERGFIEWECNSKPGVDRVEIKLNSENEVFEFPKTRADDFKKELLHIRECLERDFESNQVSIEDGIKTMFVINAAHQSNKIGKVVNIDYNNWL